jgi:hypothetical protein
MSTMKSNVALVAVALAAASCSGKLEGSSVPVPAPKGAPAQAELGTAKQAVTVGTDVTIATPTAAVAPDATLTYTITAPVTPETDVTTQTLEASWDKNRQQITGAPIFPQDWTLKYYNGYTEITPAPTSAAGFAHVNRVVATGSVDSQGVVNGTQVRITSGSATVAPAAGSFSGGSLGDGYDISFNPDRTRVYNVHHHDSPPTIMCRLTATGATCPGFPVSLFRTPMRSTARYDELRNRLWIANNNNVNGGWECLDVSGTNPAYCATRFVSAGTPVSNGYDSHVNMTMIGREIYSFDISGQKLTCLNLDGNGGAGAPCAGQPYAGFGSNDLYRTTMFELNGKLWLRIGATTTCFDPATKAQCAGVTPWTSPRAGALMAVPSANGVVENLCVQNDCRTLAGGAHTLPASFITYMTNNVMGDPGDNWYHVYETAYGGSRFFYPQRNAMRCFDIRTGSECWGVKGVTRIYTPRIDPTNENCVWTNGDDGVIRTWDAVTGLQGCATPPPVRTFRAEAAVPRLACSEANRIAAWVHFKVVQPAPNTYTSAILTARDTAGNVIPGFVDLPYAPGQTLDISSLTVAQTGQNPTFEVRFENLTDNATLPRGEFKSRSEPPQLCVTTAVPSPCPAGPVFADPIAAPANTNVVAKGNIVLATGPRAYTPATMAISQSAKATSACGGTLNGTILTASGAPVVGAVLTLSDSSGSGFLDGSGNPISATTNASGAYTFFPIRDGQYKVILNGLQGSQHPKSLTVVVGGTGTVTAATPSGDSLTSNLVTVSAGGTSTVNGVELVVAGNGGTCATGAECQSGVCGTDGQCGLSNGQTGCTAATASLCQSGVCSMNNANCMPVGGCYIDADCSGGQQCNAATLQCEQAPGIASSTGISVYHAGGSAVAVDPNLTVVGAGTLTGATVTIGAGFDAAHDRLAFTNAGGITGSYNQATGVLTLTGTASTAAYQAALRAVTYSNVGGSLPNTAQRVVTFTIGAALANPANGHYYEFVTAPASTSWTQAQDGAAARTYLGLRGYLVTITDAAETAFVKDKIAGGGWIGMTAVTPTCPRAWRWVTGPEAGTDFFTNTSPGAGTAIGGRYINWGPGQPDGCGGGETYGQVTSVGNWNDLPLTVSAPGTIFEIKGYVVEYGGMPTDPVRVLSATKVMQPKALPTVAVTTNGASVPFGTSVRFTATLTPSTSTGSVQFKDGATNLGGPVTIVNGAASATTTTLTVGPHTISAVYSGDLERQGGTGTLAGGQTIVQFGNGQGSCNATNASSVCASGVCGSNGTCGYAAGDGPCTVLNAATLCTTGVCSSAGSCMPATPGACFGDADCGSGQFCERSTFACTSKLAAGASIPNNGLHDGTCTAANAAAVCASGACNPSRNTCSAPSGTACTSGAQCTTNSCSASGACVPNRSSCFADSDCQSGRFCARSTFTCTDKLAGGSSLPADGLHDTCSSVGTSSACVTGICNRTANTCASPDSAACSVAAQCASNTCSPSGRCVPAGGGGCFVDGDCGASQYCEQANLTCRAKLAPGAPIPTDGVRTGVCVPGAEVVCAAGVCNPSTNTCAAAVGATCTAADQCTTNACQGGRCGLADGATGCTTATANLCQSGACSASAGRCIPASGGCYEDGDCGASQWCERSALACRADKTAGAALPVDGLHDGVCTESLAAAVCATGKCNAVANTCAAANTATCSVAGDCVSNVCASNGQCGVPDGSGPCTVATGAFLCQSGRCNASADGSSSACIPQGTSSCWADADCAGGRFCHRATFTCTLMLAAGTPVPQDGVHDLCGFAGVNAACTSGRCNPTTGTCALANNGDCTAANQCVSNVCGSNGRCGYANGQSGCVEANGAALCQSGSCSPSAGACVSNGGCWLDGDCAAGERCDRAAQACKPKLGAGDPIPTDGVRTGACTASAAEAVCASGVCNAVTNTCALRPGESCTAANQCTVNACGSNGKCGFADGQAGCTPGTAERCQSGACSIGNVCVPAGADRCWVDGDCPTREHCARSTTTCVVDAAAGQPIPNDTLHTGVCNDANALAACASGACNAITNTCAVSNGDACADAKDCVVNACGSNGRCGIADGQSGCDVTGAAACQSGACSTAGVCVASGKCWVDADCGATLYCKRSSGACTPKGTPGAAIPNDGLHDGTCNEANARATCETGLCNTETNTCATDRAAACTTNADCASGVCGSDGSCGTPGGQGCTSNVQCRSGACVGGTCTIPGAKVTGQGLLECAVGESSGSSPSAPSPWAFLVVGAAVLLRRRGERGTSAR